MEFAYSISEHGLTPATVRNYVRLMTDRMEGLGQVLKTLTKKGKNGEEEKREQNQEQNNW